MSPSETPIRHNFARIINTPAGDDGQPSQQFLLRLCHQTYLAQLPGPNRECRIVTIDSELPSPGEAPQPRRAVLELPHLPAPLFGAPLLAAFVWQDCAAFNKVFDWVEAGKAPAIAMQAARQELTDNLGWRLRAAWPEYFAPEQNKKV